MPHLLPLRNLAHAKSDIRKTGGSTVFCLTHSRHTQVGADWSLPAIQLHVSLDEDAAAVEKR